MVLACSDLTDCAVKSKLVFFAYKTTSVWAGIAGFDVGKPWNWEMWGLLLHCIQLYTNKVLFFLKHFA